MRGRMMVCGALALGLGSVGCGGPDRMTLVVAQRQEGRDVLCACPASVGASTEAECRESQEVSRMTESEEACTRRVYDAHRAELDPVLDCQLRTRATFHECMRRALETCPPAIGTLMFCGDVVRQAADACPSASAQTDAALRACIGPRP